MSETAGQGPDRSGYGEALARAGGVAAPPVPDRPVSVPDLQRRLRAPRTLFSLVMSVLAGLMTLAALVPLVSLLLMLVVRGGKRVGVALFTQLPPAAGMPGGGVGNALLGTLLVVAIGALLSVPCGILAAIYLSEFGPETKVAAGVRFCAKVLTGLPSVLAGLFAYAAVVVVTGRYSAVAAGVALGLLMLPIVLLTAEQALKSVPQRMREAVVGMGATRAQAVWHVILPAALPGVLTGVMLAVARAAGETAPLLFTALFSDYWLTANPMEPTPSLAVLIYEFSTSPFTNQIEIAWAASLVLVVLVLLANVGAQAWARRSANR